MKRLLIIILALVFQNAFAQEQAGELIPDINWYIHNIKSDSYQIKNAAELADLPRLSTALRVLFLHTTFLIRLWNLPLT